MATRKKNPSVQLPKNWTTAQVRVNPQGKVQVKISPNKVRQNSHGMRTFQVFRYGSYIGTVRATMTSSAINAAKRKWGKGPTYTAREAMKY